MTDRHVQAERLFESGQREQAALICAGLLKRNPGFYPALYLMARIRQDQRRSDAALALIDTACRVLPESDRPRKTQAWNLRGSILHQMDRHDDALASYDRASAYGPSFAQVWHNRGNVLRELYRVDEAIQSYDKAISIDPEYVDAHLYRGIAYLLKRDFRRGFEGYEWRFRSQRWNVKPRSEPRWTGRESVAGKTLLIQAEQGYGDMIQFARFVRPVADLGARVVFRVPKSFKSFLACVDGYTGIIDDDEPLPPFDYQCPLMSLCLALGVEYESIPTAPYLKTDSALVEQWRQRLGIEKRLRVGLTWSGRSEYNHNPRRSMPLQTLAPLLAIPTCQFYCIQTDVPESDRDAMQATSLIDLGVDFPNTAAIVENLDLVISIDTSIAHLSGALGKPTWVMSAKPQKDWRFIPGQTTTPWYPGMRVFWQDTPGDWTSVVSSVARELSDAGALDRHAG